MFMGVDMGVDMGAAGVGFAAPILLIGTACHTHRIG